MERPSLPLALAGLSVAGVAAVVGYQMGRAGTGRTAAATSTGQPSAFRAGDVDINAAFDSGNIECVDSSSIQDIQLKIKQDPFTAFTDKSAHSMWFYFRASSPSLQGQPASYRIVNAGKVSYPQAWPGYQVAYSYNPSAASPEWRRCPSTAYHAAQGELAWTHTSERAQVWFAYFAPYSYERHQQALATAGASPLARVDTIGRSLAGRAMDRVVVGTGSRVVWLIGRQHPGESMASWWMDGVLRSLTDENDEQMKKLRTMATVHVVPLMCPDGAVAGYLRTNAVGSNLNREWGDKNKFPGYDAPTMHRSPEVVCVQEEMNRTGCDVFFDVHGDEEIPDNFFAGSQGTLGWNQNREDEFVYLSGRCKARDQAFQIGRGYGDGGPHYLAVNDGPGQAALAMASDWVAHHHDCLAVTLEMPFKDTEAEPNAEFGWSPERCQALGASNLLAILDVLSHMQQDGSMDDAAKRACVEIKANNPGAWWKPADA